MTPNSPFKKTNYTTSMCDDSITEFENGEDFLEAIHTPKRLRFDKMEERPEEMSVDPGILEEVVPASGEKEVSVVDILQPVGHRFNLALSSGMTFRASLSLRPSTALVGECLDAIKYCFSMNMETGGWRCKNCC
jgi:hypothetical protein